MSVGNCYGFRALRVDDPSWRSAHRAGCWPPEFEQPPSPSPSSSWSWSSSSLSSSSRPMTLGSHPRSSIWWWRATWARTCPRCPGLFCGFVCVGDSIILLNERSFSKNSKFHLRSPPVQGPWTDFAKEINQLGSSWRGLDFLEKKREGEDVLTKLPELYLILFEILIQVPKYQIHVPNAKHLKKGRIDILICNSAKLTCWNNMYWECQIQGLKTFLQKTRFFCITISVTMFSNSKEQYIQRKLKYQFFVLCKLDELKNTYWHLISPTHSLAKVISIHNWSISIIKI